MIDLGLGDRRPDLPRRRQQLEQARWVAGAEQQRMQQRGAMGRNLGRLPEHGIAGRQGLRDLHAVEQGRIIPGADDRDHPVRPAINRVPLPPQPERPRAKTDSSRLEQLSGLAFEEPAGVGERKHVAAEDFARRPAEFCVDGGTKIVGRINELLPECLDGP